MMVPLQGKYRRRYSWCRIWIHRKTLLEIYLSRNWGHCASSNDICERCSVGGFSPKLVRHQRVNMASMDWTGFWKASVRSLWRFWRASTPSAIPFQRGDFSKSNFYAEYRYSFVNSFLIRRIHLIPSLVSQTWTNTLCFIAHKLHYSSFHKFFDLWHICRIKMINLFHVIL